MFGRSLGIIDFAEQRNQTNFFLSIFILFFPLFILFLQAIRFIGIIETSISLDQMLNVPMALYTLSIIRF